MLPRLAVFRADRLNISHLVMVDGDVFKPLCIRNPIKHGHLLNCDDRVTCENCKNKGWTKTLGRLGAFPVEIGSDGRYISQPTKPN